jgi:hypothetical protein
MSNQSLTVKLSHNIAREIAYRLDIVAEEPDLLDDYQVTAESVEGLSASIPNRKGGGDWEIPSWAFALLLSELETAADISFDVAREVNRHIVPDWDCSNEIRQHRALKTEVRSFNKLAEAIADAASAR